MKLINPFDRKKKKDFIPLSLFPIKKMTRTSEQIGRFVPLFACEMSKNNRIKLSWSQLMRLNSMRAPVMQNFEAEYGAFFVPFVAFDKFFDSSWFKENILCGAGLTDFNKEILRARDFFNPATPNSLRKHPTHIRRKEYGSDFIGVGSLFDHLQMPLYFEELEPKFNYDDVDNSETETDLSFENALGIFNSTYGTIDSGSYFRYDTYDVPPFIAYVWAWAFARATNTHPSDYYSILLAGSQYPVLFNAIASEEYLVAGSFRVVWETSLLTDAVGYAISGNVSLKESYDRLLLGVRPIDLVEGYQDFITNIVSGKLYGSRDDSNITAFLAYLAIYGHYCLNELFTTHEDFNDMVGCAYLSLARNYIANAGYGMTSAFTAGYLSAYCNEKLVSDPSLEFFANYLKKCECLPVLWNKDTFTAAQREETLSSTPIGSTIVENFFNRMYARFKDLIARMGGDYKTNSDALYGGSIPDSTLCYPQIVGYRRFGVQVGDIAQTSESSTDSFLGEFAGYAVSRDSSDTLDWTAEEPGIFMVCNWVRPKHVAIANAIPRLNLKSDYFDYLIPQFGGVGYQDIPYKQIYPADPNPNQKFGIQERYFEYMEMLNECSGLMRTRLKHYHCDRILEDSPTSLLDTQTKGLEFLYITEKDNVNRIFNDQFSDPVLCACYFEGSITRQLPATIQTEF